MARLALIVFFALLVVGCGGRDEQDAARPLLNGSDQSFIREMISHHRGAIVMARIAVVKSKDQRVKALAEKIISGQEEEVSQMRAYRLSPLPADQTGQADHHHGAEADPLLASKNFDRDFLRAMIVHHQGALPMSQIEIKDGQNKKIKTLAAKIIQQQTQEINRMKLWLNQIESQKLKEPVINEQTKGRPSKTKDRDRSRPLKSFNLGSLVIDKKNPQALMTTAVRGATAGSYGVEVINKGEESYDIVVAIVSSGQERFIEEIIEPGQSKMMSADFQFKGKRERDFTINVKVKR